MGRHARHARHSGHVEVRRYRAGVGPFAMWGPADETQVIRFGSRDVYPEPSSQHIKCLI